MGPRNRSGDISVAVDPTSKTLQRIALTAQCRGRGYALILHLEEVPEFRHVIDLRIVFNVHIVFATKGRAPMIERNWIQEMHNYLGERFAV